MSPRANHAGPWVVACALMAVALQLVAAFTDGMGFHAQELYTFACGQSLSWGALDGPQLAPLMSRCVSELAQMLGVSAGEAGEVPLAMLLMHRMLPAAAAGWTVYLAGHMARQAGGGRWSALLAALACLCAPGLLVQHSALTAASLELLAVTALASSVLGRLGRPEASATAQSASQQATQSTSWLLPGLALGLLLQSKLTGWTFAAGLVAGLLVLFLSKSGSTRRPAGLQAGLPLGASLAGLLVAPFLIWQALAAWPVWDYIWAEHVLSRGLLSVPEFVARFALLAQPLSLPLWVTGLGLLLFGRAASGWRPLLGLVLVPLAVLLVSSSGRPDRLLPVLPLLLALGAVGLERLLRAPSLRASALLLLALGGAWTAPLALPLMNPARTQAWAEQVDVLELRDLLTRNMLSRMAWPEMSSTVLAVVDGLSDEERAGAVLLALSGGQAGALQLERLLSPGRAVPPVYSAHNALFERPPGPGLGRVAVSIAWPLHRLRALFADVRRVAVHQPALADPQELDLPVYVCREPRLDLATAWPGLRRLQAARDLD